MYSDTMCDVHLVNNPTPLGAKDHFEIVINSNDDNSSSDDDSLYKENIEYVEASPHDSELFILEAAEIFSSTSPKSFLEETNTFHNSLPEFENFYFDLEEISSGSTTTLSDISLPDYEAFSFDDDHIKEISSGSTTTHFDISLSEYDSFIFDFTDEELADELAHIISPPKYDCLYFWNFPDPGELLSILNSGIRENLSTTSVNLPVEDDYSPLLAYVVWIFLAYLTYPVIPPYLHTFRNEDTIFDRGITINHFCSFKPGLSHCIPENLKTLAKGFYPPSLHFLSFNWESCLLPLLPLPTRTPFPPPRDSATGRPALRVITLGGIIHTRDWQR
nr:hypothetical protein [Tanacetum cinerariifolium]